MDMSDSNPYVESRREWNDRYLELARERRWWQAVAGTELVLNLILAGGLIWLSLQHKTVPYIVEVDSLGAAMTILLRLSPTSWQLRWTEEQRGLDGPLLGKSQWEGIVTTEVVPPASEDTILVNPLGLYVTDLRWTKQL